MKKQLYPLKRAGPESTLTDKASAREFLSAAGEQDNVQVYFGISFLRTGSILWAFCVQKQKQ